MTTHADTHTDTEAYYIPEPSRWPIIAVVGYLHAVFWLGTQHQ